MQLSSFICVMKMVYMILFVGSDVNRQDVDGRTPLMLACAHDDGGKCVEYLLSHKADPSIVDNKVRLICINLDH